MLALAVAMPVLAAAACPACYGFERLAGNVFVDREMAGWQRDELREIDRRRENVGPWFFRDASNASLKILACSSERCDKALGGKGARAVTYSSVGFSVLRLPPTRVGPHDRHA